MKYVSIDIETTGLDSEKNSILSIGAIIEDTSKKLSFDDIPKFNTIIPQHEISGSPRAIVMNKKIIRHISTYLEGTNEEKQELIDNGGYQFLSKDDVIRELYRFICLHLDIPNCEVINTQTKPVTINVAGKNFSGFDKLFLEKLPWWKKLIRVRSRVIDPAVLFCDFNTDETLPSLTTCKERGGIDGIVTHDAIDDAWDVIELLRKKY